MAELNADQQRGASIRDEQEERLFELEKRIVASGVLELILFGQLNLIVTNGVIQEFSITSTFKPKRQKPLSGTKATA
jgi:hypothetical protein